ncbi:kelch-like protein 17 isoform X6 [Enhydra lutris kenyoni]|uniref:Kelch-like protein 17 isoform X6 n=1 Tax=Enhydra lutris kenyoni TaxID=391180 RepID=A0A2Y9KMJ4_ENHLU|nr:kelch-like protein 17 isoform X6 [Enhydra lutris kenyoni]
MQPRGERPAGRTQSPEHGSPGPGPEAPPPPPPPQPQPPAPEAERARPRQARPTAPMEGAMQLLSREGHTVSHNSKRHYHDAFVAMSRMRQRGLLCDIVLHVAAKEIRAHKVVLASCSPYFHAMFTNEMSESRQTHVTLHDIDPQALDQLVQFAYTAEIVVGEGNVQVRLPGPSLSFPLPQSLPQLRWAPVPQLLVFPCASPAVPHGPFPCPCSPGSLSLSRVIPQTLLPAASLLQLNGVRDACCKFLLSQLDPSNCLGIRGFADTHSCSDLLKAAHRYVLQHFVDVAKTEEFMLLPLKQVLELVSSDSLNVPSEEDVYRAVLSWVKHDVDARRQHVPRLMKCVRLPLLSRDFLLGHVDAESLVRHHPDCKDLLIEALKFHLLPEQRGVLGTSRTRPRRCEGAGPVLFAVGMFTCLVPSGPGPSPTCSPSPLPSLTCVSVPEPSTSLPHTALVTSCPHPTPALLFTCGGPHVVVGACSPSTETVKHMTRALTAGTWWPPCPRAGPGWACQQLGTGCMLWLRWDFRPGHRRVVRPCDQHLAA